MPDHIKLGRNLPSRANYEWFFIGIQNQAIILTNIGDTAVRGAPSYADVWNGNIRQWQRANIGDTIVFNPASQLLEVRVHRDNQLIDTNTTSSLKALATGSGSSKKAASDHRVIVDVPLNTSDINKSLLALIQKLTEKGPSSFSGGSRIKVIVE